MCAGKKSKVRLGGRFYDVDWRIPYYSDKKFINAPDEDVARYELRNKLKRKWTGFILLGSD